ncbi:MAG: hypothetical protein KF760_01935 [Candidatus Eremiobacteraeota bacterium]|nr:hypothetical protein [Candidatus Eremiobacteraeota bacterium]MCW5872344.1 hypothetical protein [Candidatus Eremiobacteraeota bacterium]
MKRIYWLLIAAVPVLLWWLSQGGSHQEAQQPNSAKPDADKPPSAPETTPEAVKDLPTSSNGTFPKAAPAEAPVAGEAAPPAEAPAEKESVVEEAPALVPPVAPPEKLEEAAETAPPTTPQIEVSPAAPVEGEPIQVFDSKDRALDCQLLDITSSQALVRCPESLPEKEKARLVLPFGSEAITVNGQLAAVEDGISRFKIMTMKAGQKKRFEDYLSQRLGL